MSQLYLTSSLIPNIKLLSFEELFKYTKPEDILLVFDTNLVIYYREFYLNSEKFIGDHGKNDIYLILRYFIEQIERYNLIVNASIGVDESSRSKKDCNLILEKVEQTHEAIMNLFAMDITKFDTYVKQKLVIEPIIDRSKLTTSKVGCLSQKSMFQNLLIVSYAAALKLYILQTRIDKKTLTPRDAYIEFHEFMTIEVNCTMGTISLFALHLFGGVDKFKSMIFAKSSASVEEKIHQLYNGAIDLIYPYIVNRVQNLFPPLGSNKKLIPILVTMDKKMATLHSLINTKVIFESNDSKPNFNPELIEIKFIDKMSWNDDDLKHFKSLFLKDIYRVEKNISKTGREVKHLLPVVAKYEKI